MKIIAILFVSVLFIVRTGISQELEVITLTEPIPGGTGGVSVDKKGNIYVSDFGPLLGQGSAGTNNKIFKITPDGSVSVFAEGFEGASGSHFDSKGKPVPIEYSRQPNYNGQKERGQTHLGEQWCQGARGNHC